MSTSDSLRLCVRGNLQSVKSASRRTRKRLAAQKERSGLRFLADVVVTYYSRIDAYKEESMIPSLASIVLCGLLTGGEKEKTYQAGYLCEPAYAIDEWMRAPLKCYVPQPGDIYMSTDKS